jgi:hypothetical protein
VAGTLVETQSGLRPIEQIAVGDLVLSRNADTGETAYKPVSGLIHRHDREIYAVTLVTTSDDGREHISTLETTDDHPWRSADGRWLTTLELRPGVTLVRAQGTAQVLGVSDEHRTAQTYNLQVDDFHTYFVGEEHIWVHNACGRSPEAQARAEANMRRGVPESQIGPSGHPYQHTVEYSSRKEAREAAEHEAPEGGSVRHDATPGNPNQGPHFQAEDANGDNVHPTVHHEYPD